MITKIRRKDLLHRLINHLGLNYITLISVIKSVILANAAYSIFLMINKDHLNITNIILWFASFLSMVLVYQAFTIGIIIIAWIPTVKDVILPFTVGITEFVMFSVITDPNTVVHWNLMFALFSTAAFFIILNVILKTNFANYDKELHSLVNRYISSQKVDLAMSLSTAIVWSVVWIATMLFSSWRQYQWVYGAAAIIIMLVAIYRSEQDRNLIARSILKNHTKRSS